MMNKTNVMRLLDAAHIDYVPHEYDNSVTDGETVARLVGIPAERVFKTLVTEGGERRNFVFVVPVGKTLDLKAAARAAGVKSVAMIPQKKLLPLTGYIHGGCSPIGMKKPLPTFIDASAEGFDAIVVSAGKVGHQVELSPGARGGVRRGVRGDSGGQKLNFKIFTKAEIAAQNVCCNRPRFIL